MWTDLDYFVYVMLNGGLIGLIGIPLILFLLSHLIKDLNNDNKVVNK